MKGMVRKSSSAKLTPPATTRSATNAINPPDQRSSSRRPCATSSQSRHGTSMSAPFSTAAARVTARSSRRCGPPPSARPATTATSAAHPSHGPSLSTASRNSRSDWESTGAATGGNDRSLRPRAFIRAASIRSSLEPGRASSNATRRVQRRFGCGASRGGAIARRRTSPGRAGAKLLAWNPRRSGRRRARPRPPLPAPSTTGRSGREQAMAQMRSATRSANGGCRFLPLSDSSLERRTECLQRRAWSGCSPLGTGGSIALTR